MDKDRINYLIHNPTEEVPDVEIVNIYRIKCIDCRKPTIEIHEIIPRSLLLSWRRWINRVLLCPECHAKAHSRGTISSKEYLVDLRNQRLGEYWDIWLTQQ